MSTLPSPSLPDEQELDKILTAFDALGLAGPFWWSLDGGLAILFSSDSGRQVVAVSRYLSFREKTEQGHNVLTNAAEVGADNPAAIALASAWLVPVLLRELREAVNKGQAVMTAKIQADTWKQLNTATERELAAARGEVVFCRQLLMQALNTLAGTYDVSEYPGDGSSAADATMRVIDAYFDGLADASTLPGNEAVSA